MFAQVNVQVNDVRNDCKSKVRFAKTRPRPTQGVGSTDPPKVKQANMSSAGLEMRKDVEYV